MIAATSESERCRFFEHSVSNVLTNAVRRMRGVCLFGVCTACTLLAPDFVRAEEVSPAETASAAPEALAPEPAPPEPAVGASGAPEAAANTPPAATPNLPLPVSVTEPITTALPPMRRPVRHGIGLRLGPRATTVREDLLVPLTFSGGGPDLGASYRGHLGRGLLDTRLDLGAAVVSNRFGNLGFTIHHALAAAYRLPLPSSRAWRFALGGAIGESVDSLGLQMWDDAHGYWAGLGWLGPSASLQGPLAERWQLVASAELALVGTVGRPPERRNNKQDPNNRLSYYLFHPFADSSLFAPWDLQFLRFDVTALQTSADDGVGRGWSFGGEGRFLRATEPATLLVFEAVLYAAWTWGL
jgi:hypothetical protein